RRFSACASPCRRATGAGRSRLRFQGGPLLGGDFRIAAVAAAVAAGVAGQAALEQLLDPAFLARVASIARVLLFAAGHRHLAAPRNAHFFADARLDLLADRHGHAFGDLIRHFAGDRVRNHLADRVGNLLVHYAAFRAADGVGHLLDAALLDDR